ncbi:MAG: hypothetical protein WCF05_09000 [Chromatiaceae bacterium]
MKTLLAKKAEILVTMDGERRELKNTSLYAEDGIVKQTQQFRVAPDRLAAGGQQRRKTP